MPTRGDALREVKGFNGQRVLEARRQLALRRAPMSRGRQARSNHVVSDVCDSELRKSGQGGPEHRGRPHLQRFSLVVWRPRRQ